MLRVLQILGATLEVARSGTVVGRVYNHNQNPGLKNTGLQTPTFCSFRLFVVDRRARRAVAAEHILVQ